MRVSIRFVVASVLVVASLSGCGVRTSLEVERDGSVAPPGDGGRDAGRPDGGPCRSPADCDDGLYCNGSEGCVGGTCIPGAAPVCDDFVPCTEDRCQEDTDSCTSIPNDALCGPGSFCDPFAGCVGRTCVGDVECDDGFACNGHEICGPDGICVGGIDAPRCDDGIDCTIDVCDEPGICTSFPDDSRCPGGSCDLMLGCTDRRCTSPFDCDDGRVCNGAEQCLGGRCVPGPAIACADPFACTRDECVEAIGRCTSTPDSSRCPAGLFCDPRSGSPDGCTRRPCRSDFECDDGAFCNGIERCDPGTGTCVSGPPPSCDDFQACTLDRCVEGLGCLSEPRAARETCGNLIDDDCDAQVDCADSDCRGAPGCPSCTPMADFEFACSDGIDQDCDGAPDCADVDCVGSFECCRPRSMVEFECFDGTDDDCDGAFDCADLDCARACGLPEDCGNRIDDDRDGLTDCRDPDCALDFRCARDGGGPVDAGPIPDGGPLPGEIGIAACTNGRDDDGDGRVDCRDSDCSPFGPMGECCDDRDNDGDGTTDVFTCRCFDDSTCVGVGDFSQVCWESTFSICAPRCNFYGGDAFCRMYLPDLPRCNARTGECTR